MADHTLGRGVLAAAFLATLAAVAAPPPAPEKPKSATPAQKGAADAKSTHRPAVPQKAREKEKYPRPQFGEAMPPDPLSYLPREVLLPDGGLPPLDSLPDAGAYLPPSKPFRWDVPKVVHEVEVPETFETNGIPNRFHMVVVALPYQETYAHFLRSFKEQGLWVDPPEKQLQLEGQLMLTGFDPNTETSYSVILQPYENGHTGVILAEAYFKDRTFAARTPYGPVFPGAESMVTQNLETGTAMSYRVKARPEEVLEFYKKTLSEAGYAQQPDGTWVQGADVVHLVAKTSEDNPAFTDVALIRTAVTVQPQKPY